jgi:hypothetical protein
MKKATTIYPEVIYPYEPVYEIQEIRQGVITFTKASK